jgi:cell division protease FtsH
MQMPTEDRYLMTRTELLNRLTVLLGGRAAEMAIFHEATTGAADDLQRATEMARSMVTRYGMEPEVGQATYVAERPRYLDVPGFGPQQAVASEETSAEIDKAVRGLVQQAFDRAAAILKDCTAIHQESAQRLLEKETFVEEDLAPIRAAVSARRGVVPQERETSHAP